MNTSASVASDLPVGITETAAAPRTWQPQASSLLSYILALLLCLAGAAAILASWQLPPFATSVVVTDNAYVRGRTTVISPQVSGYISDIPANDYQDVSQGQMLLRIDDRAYRAQVAQSKANLDLALANLANNRQAIAQRGFDIVTADAQIASARAQLAKADADLDRANRLTTQGAFSISGQDAARATRNTAAAALQEAEAGRDNAVQAKKAAEINDKALQAGVEGAKAQLQAAEINLGYTIVKAPEAGKLSDIGARRGQYVTNGSQLLFLVPQVRWVVANFKEAQTASIRRGQKAWFFVDALGGARFEGTVEDISPATGSEFSVLRTDNAIGNFTKIPQRISVKIRIDAGQRDIMRLAPGMSVEAHVETTPKPT